MEKRYDLSISKNSSGGYNFTSYFEEEKGASTIAGFLSESFPNIVKNILLRIEEKIPSSQISIYSPLEKNACSNNKGQPTVSKESIEHIVSELNKQYPGKFKIKDDSN